MVSDPNSRAFRPMDTARAGETPLLSYKFIDFNRLKAEDTQRRNDRRNSEPTAESEASRLQV